MTAEAINARFLNRAHSINHATMSGQEPLHAFQVWLDEALRQIVIGNDGGWTARYVRSAADTGQLHAKSLLKSSHGAIRDRTTTVQSLVASELQGICDAVSQQATREFANAEMFGASPNKVAQSVGAVIKSIGVVRSRAMAEFMLVRAHALATLDTFRAGGVDRVGTQAERKTSSAALTRDAKKKVKKKRVNLNEVQVLTAGDNEVCEECQDISDNGPYDLEDAELLIPAHPRCRCAFVPANDARFASVHDAFDPDEPRNENGMWTTGGKPYTVVQAKKSLGGAQMSRDTEVLQNPPLREITQLLKENSGGVRSFIDKQNNLYVWPADAGTHEGVANSLKLNIQNWGDVWPGLHKGKFISTLEGGKSYPAWLRKRVHFEDSQFVSDHIVRLASGKYRLLTHTGKNLGTFGSHVAAARHEGEVEYFKAHDGFDPDEPSPVHDSRTTRAAGVMLINPTGRILFVRRSSHGDHAGEWCLPAGAIDRDESAEEAMTREVYEEVGYDEPLQDVIEVDHKVSDEGVEFTTFAASVPAFTPKLNGEHTDYCWREPDNAPLPLHPGLLSMLQRIQLHDYDPSEERDEYGQWVQGAATTLTHKTTGAQATIINEQRGYALVTEVGTPPGHRGMGGADAVMTMVEHHLDERGLRARLVVGPKESGTSAEGLRNLYAAHGFEPGRNAYLMNRAPKKR
jgi:8-oxo-dGTP pyrophosphatase MutT (NUDIX family)